MSNKILQKLEKEIKDKNFFLTIRNKKRFFKKNHARAKQAKQKKNLASTSFNLNKKCIFLAILFWNKTETIMILFRSTFEAGYFTDDICRRIYSCDIQCFHQSSCNVFFHKRSNIIAIINVFINQLNYLKHFLYFLLGYWNLLGLFSSSSFCEIHLWLEFHFENMYLPKRMKKKHIM